MFPVMSHLSRIAGVIYPDVLQVDNLTDVMLDMMSTGTSGEKRVKAFKNAEIGVVGSTIAINEAKNCFLVLDGLIENIPELRRHLKAAGNSRMYETAAEVLLAAYELWREHFLEKIDGSFALAVIDMKDRELLLARDRIGKQPLYWYQDKSHLIFGSELKALLATGLIPQTPSRDALAMYLYFGFIPQDLSPIAGVNKLLPSHYFIWREGKGRSVKPYWSYSEHFKENVVESPKEILDNLAHLLAESTQNLIPPR